MEIWGNIAESPSLRPVADRRPPPGTGGRKDGIDVVFPQHEAVTPCAL